jgi:aerobic-type carbon monoxide dehydrogenase small subunit (CoxS/CutS family)
MKKTIHFKLNGKARSLALDRERMLLWVLRTEFGLTGTKYGCGAGLCGACTVLVNKKAVRSCQFPVEGADGKEILTIEGLARNGKLHPLQEAFVKHDALQCGYCTPGMILTAYGLLAKNPWPNLEEIREEMNDNLCRCGSYQRILRAIQDAAQAMKGGSLL